MYMFEADLALKAYLKLLQWRKSFTHIARDINRHRDTYTNPKTETHRYPETDTENNKTHTQKE